MTERIEDWPYCNYSEWVGARRGRLIDREFVAARFPDSAAYVRFVEEYLSGLDRLPESLRPYLLDSR